MRKSKKIFLTLCLATTFLGAGVFSACDIDKKEPNAGSNVQTPIEMEYKVKFDSIGGSTVKAQYVKKGDKATKPENPTREGYTFVEWQLNRNSYDFDSAVTSDITLTAKWAQNEPTKFTVNFVVEGETIDTKEVIEGKQLIEPVQIPILENYIFDNWTIGGEAYDFEMPVMENLTLVAKFTRAWTVTVDTGNGTAVESTVLKEGSIISVPETSLEGYYVSDWLVDGESYDFAKPIVSDITLTAVWKASGWTSNQISVISNGWDVSNNAGYLDVVTGSDGEIKVTTIFSGSNTCYSALVLRNLFPKEYYEEVIASGDTRLEFKLAVDGELSDLYVFGKALSEYWSKDGVYTISVDLQYIVDNYATIGKLGNVLAKDDDLNQMMIAWKNEATAWGASRNYVFTISDVTLKPMAIFNMNFVAGNTDVIEVGQNTKLEVSTDLEGAIEWKSSDESVATVENGVVTGVKGGTVTITASLGGNAASKTVYVVGGLYSNQIGVLNNGWAYESKEGYFNMAIGGNDELIVTTKINVVKENPSGLVLRKLFPKEYYEKLLASGYTKLSFNLAVGGTDGAKVSDLCVFGKALTSFANSGGVYTVDVNLQDIVANYATVGTLGNATQAVKAQLNQMLIGLDDTTNNWSTRNYVFTISNTCFIK